jgi:hypothetical protein
VELRGPTGVLYQVEVQIFYDDEATRTVLVIGSIDDGGLRAFIPLSDSFIVRPDGTLTLPGE